MKITKFEDLEVWKLGKKLATEIHNSKIRDKLCKDLSLKNQIERAVISITSNIAEGFEKNNNNEFVRYLKIAKGSAGEVRSQLIIAHEMGYIDKNDLNHLNNIMLEISSKLRKFILYLEAKKRTGNFIAH